MTIYKAFVRPHLDYGDIIYDEAYNETFHQKLEYIQYNACLALLGTIRDRQEKAIPIIRLGIPQTLSLVQDTYKIILQNF